MDFEIQAKETFEASICAPMSHTLKGLEKFLTHAINKHVEINLIKRPLPSNKISENGKRITGHIQPQWVGVILTCNIAIDPDLTPEGARFIVCHELYHLLQYIECYKKAISEGVIDPIKEADSKYNNIPHNSPQAESQATAFACRLCHYHHVFLNTDKIRKKYKRIHEAFSNVVAESDAHTVIENLHLYSQNEDECFNRHLRIENIMEDCAYSIKNDNDRLFTNTKPSTPSAVSASVV